MAEKEIWLPIAEYEGWYEVSNLGRVRSIDRSIVDSRGITRFCKGQILKPAPTSPKGYLGVMLCKNGIGKTKKIHRLVAETFIPNPEDLPEVNHKDENTLNNNIDNLEWVSSQYNINYGTRLERISQQKRGKAPMRYIVYQLNMNNDIIKEYPSIAAASRETGIKATTIRTCGLKYPCNKSVDGFKWRIIPREPEKCAFDIK